MKLSRRAFLGLAGAVAGTCAGRSAARPPGGPHDATTPTEGLGVLVDLTQCIGCRKCEWACNQANGLPVAPVETFEDKSVFVRDRRPDATCYTIVNEAANGGGRPTWIKSQCMHCLEPACASACIVSALEREPNGAVRYDASRCIGCRYCMVACPFQIPGYEYEDATSPEVRKCTLCFDRLSTGGVPACVEICPPQCLTFGPRAELLELARHKIARSPGKYIDHVYGEHEVGGTSWLYVSSRPFETLGFPTLSNDVPSHLTESIQHGVFKHFLPPLALYGVLAMILKASTPEEHRDETHDPIDDRT
jgi:Fe-S-cluster-containing dehydrogenase component